jgi:hypothetical protein
MSPAPHSPSLRVARIQPKRRHTRQQCVSTGKTPRPSEYIITHRATLVPTPSSDVRNASHCSSFICLSGASVTLPKAASMRSQMILILRDFVGDKPPCFSGPAIFLRLALAGASKLGNALRSAPKVRL